MAENVVCFFGVLFPVVFADIGLHLELVGNNVISILLILVEDVVCKGRGDEYRRLEFCGAIRAGDEVVLAR